MVSEIPLLYAKQEGRCLRYRLLENGTLARVADFAAGQNNSTISEEMNSDLNHLVGCSSVSSLEDDDDSFVATLPLGNAVSVTLVQGCEVHRRVELEFLTDQLPIAKVKCFPSSTSTLHLLVADAKACIYTIVLDRETMTPQKNYTTLDIPQLLEEMELDYSGAELHTTMIEFISHKTAILAVAPFLLTLDIVHSSLYLWSEEIVSENMTRSVTAILNRAGSILLGRVDDGTGMAPVAAISYAGENHIMSLHADAAVRHWVLDAHSCHPLQVHLVSTALPDDWVTSLAPFSFAITAQAYDNDALAAVVHIHSKSQGSTLCLIQSRVSDAYYHSVTALTIPDEVERVIVFSLQAQTPQLVVVGTEITETANNNMTHYTHLVYPAHNRTIIETAPTIASVDYTLDGVAEEELNRLLPLVGDTLDDVDQVFLKHLFRPRYPRATATTMGPCSAAVQAAIAKHVSEFRHKNLASSSPTSLELQVLLAMQQWRRTEKSSSVTMRTESVYDSYGDADMDKSDDQQEDESSDDVDAHLRRWKAFCKTLWDYEADLRHPLRIDTLSSSGQIILMRASTLSVLVEGVDEPFDEVVDSLDDQALNLLNKVEHEKQEALASVEAAATQIVTSFSIALEPDHFEEVIEIKGELQQLGLWATDTESRSKTKQVLRNLAPSQLAAYLDSAPAEVMLPGLSSQVIVATEATASSISPHVRHVAAALVVRGVDAMRRLIIGRCLVLLVHYNDNAEIQNLVVSKYLRTLATLYALAQHVPLPARTLTFGESPPSKKRLSFGDDPVVSILPGNNQMTTALDAHILQANVASSDLSLSELVMMIAKTILESTFGSAKSRLPELGCLPAPSKGEIASDYPRLALRLMATATLSDKDNVARMEAIAECLLIEANHDPVKAEEMRARANILLHPNIMYQEIDPEEIGATFASLLETGKKRVASEEVIQAEEAMMRELQRVLYGYVDSEIRPDIRRLCEKETTRLVFFPFFCSGGLPRMNAKQQTMIKSLLQAMLQLSNLMNRLSIIERRTDRLGRLGDASSLNLVSQTQRTIAAIQELFPESIYKTMPEYIQLWSLLFRHAEAAGDWSTAHEACNNNPNPDRRSKNFDQLVKGMVDAGAMGELLDLCTSVAEDDMYEAAANALARGGEMMMFAGNAADYLSCLYCLFANNGDWKRAAQAMDNRYGNAVRALASSSGLNEAARQVSLSAIASYIAIKLVKDSGDAFLITGEVGPYYPSIALMEDGPVDSSNQAPKSILKRRRDRLSAATPPVTDDDDRLSRFMTTDDLLARAIRSVAFESFFLDATPLATSVLTRSDMDMTIIDKLASFGYYALAFCLAHARQKKVGTMPNGRSILHDAYSHVVCSYLVKLASNVEVTRNPEEMDEDAETLSFMSQIEYTLNEMNDGTVSSSIVGPKYGSRALLSKARQGAAAMELIRQIVLQKDPSIGLEVAEAFLACNQDAQLPQWLKIQLAGSGSNGLFGKTGNPSALCSLYMRHGRYVDACDLISQVLAGNPDRKTQAASRVPERGSMDFVPYAKIDLLWNLVDRALRQGTVDESTKSRLRVSRLRMEQSLEFHFNMLKISEQGLKSARALARDT